MTSSNVGTMLMLGLAKRFIVDRFGQVNTIVISLTVNCVRCVVYSYLT